MNPLPDQKTYDERMALIAVDQKRWQTCPVCFGKGLVANGFYSAPGMPHYPATSTMPESCRSCGGRGIVR